MRSNWELLKEKTPENELRGLTEDFKEGDARGAEGKTGLRREETLARVFNTILKDKKRERLRILKIKRGKDGRPKENK